MSLDHFLSLPRWWFVAVVVVLALLGVQDQVARGDAARAQATPCTFRSVDYTYGYVSSLDAQGVTGAEITGIDPVCAGRTVHLTLNGADGHALAGASTRVEAPRTVLVLRPSEAVLADRVDGFDVVLDN